MYLSKLLNVFIKLAQCICSEWWVEPSQELILLNHSPVTSHLSFQGKHMSAEAVTSAHDGQLHIVGKLQQEYCRRGRNMFEGACELSTFLTSEWWARWSESCRRKRGWESSFWVSKLYFSKLLNVFVKFAKCICSGCACWSESCRSMRKQFLRRDRRMQELKP